MPTQSELIANAAQVQRNLDPDAPVPAVVTHAVAAGGESTVEPLPDDMFEGNENNKRVHARLTAEKQLLTAAVAAEGAPASHRAGSALNPGDLSPPNIGGDLGQAAVAGASATADAIAHAAAWDATNAVIAATKAQAEKLPKGAKAAAGDGLLGDDSAPAAPAPAPAPAPGWQAPADSPPAPTPAPKTGGK